MRSIAWLAAVAAAGGCYTENSAFNPTSAGSGGASQSGTSDTSSQGTNATLSTESTTTSPSSTTADAESTTGPDVSDTEVVEVTDTSTGEIREDFEFTDDEWLGEFGGGLPIGVTWSNGRQGLGLEPNRHNGTFESRVFDGGPSASWTRLEWFPRAPYGRALPNGGEDEADYVVGGAKMSGLVLLLHLDQNDLGDGDPVLDDSGEENHGIINGFAPGVSSGKFGRALEKTAAAGFVELDPNALAPGASDFTWSIWYRQQECNGTTVLSLDHAENEVGTTSTWITCSEVCPGAGSPSFPVAVARVSRGADVDLCGTTELDDGEWHHLVLRSMGHPNVEAALFVDGQLEDEAAGVIPNGLTAANGEEMTIGGSSDETFDGIGRFDEVAMWHRALDDEEILHLYLRGAHRLGLRVRVCDAPGCDDGEPFVGPDGTEMTTFVDRDGPHIEYTFPGGTRGRYLQYEALMASDLLMSSPVLQSVTVAGRTE